MIAFAFRYLFLCFLISGFLAVTTAAPVAAQGKTPAMSLPEGEREKIESVVKDYILNNPEVIIQAIQSLREREELKNRQQTKANLVKLQGELLSDPNTPVGGNPKGSVTVVEFFDYRCGFCKRVFPDIVKLVDGDKDIRFVYKEFPILGPQSVTASKAGLAAWMLDKSKYEVFHKVMMAAKGALPEDRVMTFAAKSGYDVKALQKVMKDPRIGAMIERTFDLAKALDINGTPAFVIGDQVIRGAVDLETLKSLISQARGS